MTEGLSQALRTVLSQALPAGPAGAPAEALGPPPAGGTPPPAPGAAPPAPVAPAPPESAGKPPGEPPEGSTEARKVWMLAKALEEATMRAESDIMLDPKSLMGKDSGAKGYVLSGGRMILEYDIPKEFRELFGSEDEAKTALKEAVTWSWHTDIHPDAIEAAREALVPYALDPKDVGKEFAFVLKNPKITSKADSASWVLRLEIPVVPTPVYSGPKGE